MGTWLTSRNITTRSKKYFNDFFGKEIISLIDWEFDFVEDRREALTWESTIEDIIDSENESWIKAVIPPEAGNVAYKVFNFLRKNRDEAEMLVSGMATFVKGLDRLYLYQLADAQGILDMRRYDFAIDYYKNKILKEQAKKNSKEDNS